MQAIFRLFFGTFLSALLAMNMLYAESLKEGKDYIKLKNPLDVPQKSIVEIFNVGCPHCAKMGELLPKLFATIPQDVTFLPYHIITGSTFSAQASEVLAVAVSIDEERNLTSDAQAMRILTHFLKHKNISKTKNLSSLLA